MKELMKNITPNQLAYLTATLMIIISFPCCFLLNKFWLSGYAHNIQLTINILTIGIIGYCLFYLALERFIYRRIKIIYKNIHRLKLSKGAISDRVDMTNHMMDRVEEEVMEWANEKKEEIEELKRMETYRREYLGNVSHELKTPIYNVQGYLDTLINGGMYDENINRSYLHKAMQNAERLSAILDDLDTIARHETGELKLTWQKFNIYQLAKEIFESSEMMADANDVNLTFKEGSSKSKVVCADPDRIRQVLTNLVTNAIKYNKEEGNVWIGIYDMDKYVLVEVTDNGLGIEEKHLSRLFERFYRVDPSRSRRLGGSGLGLAIVKHIVEAHNQSIHVRSKIGVGTTFGFTLAKTKSQ